MRLPQEIIDKLLGDSNTVEEFTKLIRTLNACASLVMLYLVVKLPYDAIQTILSWL